MEREGHAHEAVGEVVVDEVTAVVASVPSSAAIAPTATPMGGTITNSRTTNLV